MVRTSDRRCVSAGLIAARIYDYHRPVTYLLCAMNQNSASFEMTWSRFAAIAVILIFSAGLARSQETDWKAGFARREITPAEPVFLAGYASRNRPSEGVASKLFVKALALEDTAGRRALLITSDLIGFRRGAEKQVVERLQSSTGLERASIVLNSSHTHTGPSLLLDVEDRSDSMTVEQAEKQIAWTQRLIELSVEAGVDALEQLAPARLSYGIGLAPFVMNRREWTPNSVRLGFNPSGYADRSVPILRIDDSDGQLRGVLFGAATHNTTLSGSHYFVCADYAGFSQAQVEHQYPNTQAMFVTGCAGSSNPYPRGSLEISRQHGATLGAEVCRLLESELTPITGPLRMTFENIEMPLQPPPTREEINQHLSGRGGWRSAMADAMLKVLESGEPLPTTFEYPLSVWQFGDDLTFVGLSGEVVGEYVPLIQRAVGPGRLWIAAYCHEVFGYVPTAQVLEDGGYETRGTYYRGPGLFSADAEAALVGNVRRLTRAVGRPAVHFQDEVSGN